MLSVCGQRIINWVFVRPTRPDAVTALNSKQATYRLPAGRRLLFPLLLAEKVPFPRATKEIGDVCTQARKFDKKDLFLFAKLMQISTIFLEGLEAKLLSTWCYTRIHQDCIKRSLKITFVRKFLFAPWLRAVLAVEITPNFNRKKSILICWKLILHGRAVILLTIPEVSALQIKMLSNNKILLELLRSPYATRTWNVPNTL